MECRSSVFSLCGDNLNFKEKLFSWKRIFNEISKRKNAGWYA